MPSPHIDSSPMRFCSHEVLLTRIQKIIITFWEARIASNTFLIHQWQCNWNWCLINLAGLTFSRQATVKIRSVVLDSLFIRTYTIYWEWRNSTWVSILYESESLIRQFEHLYGRVKNRLFWQFEEKNYACLSCYCFCGFPGNKQSKQVPQTPNSKLVDSSSCPL